MAAFDFVLARYAPVELGLLAEALRTRLEGRGARVLEKQEGNDLEVRTTDSAAHVTSQAGRFVVRRDDEEDALPWFLPAVPASASGASSLLRIGLAGGNDERRLRMSWRTISELRARSFRFESVLVGRCDVPAAANEKPDEVHHDLSPAEYLAMLERIDVILECTDSFDTASFFAVAGRDAGIPVVAHEDRADLSRAQNGHAVIWSADGFVEALQTLDRAHVEPVDPGRELQRIVEMIGAS